MKTIKTKLFLVFTVSMVSLVLCGILFNALLLQKYYIYKNKRIFIEASRQIIEEFINNRKNFNYFIGQLDRVDGISCTITDKNRNVKLNSFPERPDQNAMRLPSEIEQMILKNEGKLVNSYIYSVVEKPNEQSPKLVFISQMSGGELVILRKPLKGIDESVSIANEFYIFAGFFIIILGGIFTFVFSVRITRPIIEMSIVAQDISNMDFSRKVTVKTQDEIGSLGKSINMISNKLSTSINALREDVDRRKLLVRNMSHEMKTPIGIIKGYAEGLKYGVADDPEKITKYCSVIAEECDRMDGMIRELLNLSILESGMLNLNITRFDLCELVKNVVEKFFHILDEKSIHLELKCESNIVICADCELIERAFTNFLTNAIHHVDSKNIIHIKLETVSNRPRISVFNTGSHLTEKDMENIWDVFYKVDKARTRQYGGHGLGLSIVKLIAQAHGGSCWVENVNDGVCFYFIFSG